jgi:hypothetical protein
MEMSMVFRAADRGDVGAGGVSTRSSPPVIDLAKRRFRLTFIVPGLILPTRIRL